MQFRLIFLSFFIFYGVNLFSQSDTLSYSVKDNTIHPNLKLTKEDAAWADHYKHVSGIKISRYYTVRDSLFINSTQGDSKYRVLVLSTFAQDAIDNIIPTLPEGKRLLVVLKYVNGKYSIDYINENVILNVDYSQSEPYHGIKHDSSGFSLQYFIGSVNKCKFTFYFTLENDNFYLSKYIADCYKIDLSESKKKNHVFTNKTEGRNLKNIRIEEYLQIP
jgi:hypothetical protein